MTGDRRRTAREAQGAATRERILEAARATLAEHGPDGFTTRGVAQRAGVSHGMVHYHFKDKRDLILALLVQARRDWIQPLEELVDGPGPAVDRMRAVIAWMAQPATADVMRIHMSIYVFALSDEQVRERYAAEYARVASAVRHAVPTARPGAGHRRSATPRAWGRRSLQRPMGSCNSRPSIPGSRPRGCSVGCSRPRWPRRDGRADPAPVSVPRRDRRRRRTRRAGRPARDAAAG